MVCNSTLQISKEKYAYCVEFRLLTQKIVTKILSCQNACFHEQIAFSQAKKKKLQPQNCDIAETVWTEKSILRKSLLEFYYITFIEYKSLLLVALYKDNVITILHMWESKHYLEVGFYFLAGAL